MGKALQLEIKRRLGDMDNIKVADLFLCRGGKIKRKPFPGILPDDLVVVHRQSIAQNGQIVVALLGDEATVKTLKRKGSEVWLMPANPDYQPIDGRECTILGRVVAVVRQY